MTAIRAIAELVPGIRPLEVMELLKALPATLLNNVSKEESDAAVKKLQAAGLRAESKIIGSASSNVAMTSSPATSGGLYDVNVVFYPSAKRIPVIAAVKEFKPGVTLENLVELMKKLPVSVLQGVSKAEADAAVSKLEEAGATAEVKSVGAVASKTTDSKATGNKDVILVSVPVDKKLAVIKAISEIKPNIGLEEALELIKKLPVPVLQNVNQTESELAEKALVTAGAKVEIKTLEKAPATKDATIVDVVLVSVPKEKQIAVLNVVTELKPSMTLEEVVDMLKKLPATFLVDVPKTDADVALQLLESSGAKVELKEKTVAVSSPAQQTVPTQPDVPKDKNPFPSKSKEKSTLPIKNLLPMIPDLSRISFGSSIASVKKTLGDPTVEMSLQGKMSLTYKNKSTVLCFDEKGVCEMSVWFAADCGYVVVPYAKKVLGQFSKSTLREDIMQLFGDPDDIEQYLGGKQQEFSYFYSNALPNIPRLTVKFIIATNDTLSGIIITNSR